MQKMKLWVMPTAILLICLTAVFPVKTWAQAEPSERLTRLQSFIKSTVYTFNYPTVNTAGEPIVLSSALVAWTPDERYDGDCIECVHIYSHATIGADEERPSTDGFSKEQLMLQTLPRRTYGDYAGDVQADYVGRCIVIAPDYEGFGVTKDLPRQEPKLVSKRCLM